MTPALNTILSYHPGLPEVCGVRGKLMVVRPPTVALRFAYAGAAAHESAVLHGLAATYEGLFRLEPDFPVRGRAAYRHVLRPDKWIAFNGTGWMAQHEGALGSRNGVLLLCDASCATPDLSAAIWKVTTHGFHLALALIFALALALAPSPE